MSGPFGSTPMLFSSGSTAAAAAGGQQSLKFNDDESQYLSWTPAAAGNTTTYTVSFWIKGFDLREQTIMSAENGASQTFIKLRSDGQIQFGAWNGSSYDFNLRTTALHRDPSAFYHFVCVMDGGNATSSDRQRIYVNGERRTSFTHEVYTTSGQEINTAVTHYLGRLPAAGSTQYLSALLSDVYFIDGQALDATSFGQFTNGYWKKRDYSGSYGTNGFHLTFQDDVVSEGFNTVTYRGTGSDQSISGLGFAPDLVWIKSRDEGASSYTGHNVVQDSVRGVGTNTALITNETYSEAGTGYGDAVTAFNSDGFSLGARNQVNYNNDAFVAWCWDAGSGSPVSNTDGSITSTVKANPSYGFSIASYTGTGANATVGHGLSSAPEIIIVKARSFAPSAWSVYTATTGAGNELLLNTTAASAAAANVWNNTAPTASVFTVGTAASTNQNTATYIAYCFHSVAGYSSIGSYTGNGSTSGPTVTTGFAPAFVLIKGTHLDRWEIHDNTRNPVNPRDAGLYPNATDAESTAYNQLNFSATGFQPISSNSATNANGYTYIYMAFADTREAAFWKDVSGQGNHWTPNNLDYRDSLIDSPANNFAVLNPLNAYRSGNVYSEGNLRAVPTSTYNLAYATMAQSTGKWYWEIYVEHRVITNNNTAIGLEEMPASSSYLTKGYWDFGGTRNDGSIVASDGTYPSFATGDVISVAVDFDNGKLWFAHNGSWVNSGDPSAGTNNPLSTTVGSTYSPAFFLYYTATIPKFIANFGQDSTFSGNRVAGGNQDDNGIGDFAYAPPSGYLALCTANLPTPTIVDGSEHFNTVLYNGTGSSNAVTGVGFQNDLLWIKSRSDPAGTHRLIDSVRGGSLALQSDTTGSEIDNSAQVTSPRDADGFTVDGNTSAFNQSGDTYVAWNWKAGGTAVSNTAGSITSQVSANTDAGFSIVSYTGTSSAGTIGHGLSSAPEMIIVKNRDVARNWGVYHAYNTSAPETDYLLLNLTDATDDSALPWNDIAPTSSVFSVGTSVFSNRPSEDFIAYCFHSVEGFSKAGSYTGNGSADGPFIFTGFRPAWVMVKRAVGGTSNWDVMDAVRNTYNIVDKRLYANLDDAEPAATDYVDFTSNGFKVRNTATSQNASGSTYIFLAFAENPFKYANAR